jgi:hypothetical protein
MKLSTDWEKAIDKLTRETVNGSIVWGTSIPFDRPNQVIPPVYWANVCGHLIAVYEYLYREYEDVENYSENKQMVIEFVTEKGLCLFRWSYFDYTKYWQLISAIRQQVSKANEFLNKFLGE